MRLLAFKEDTRGTQGMLISFYDNHPCYVRDLRPTRVWWLGPQQEVLGYGAGFVLFYTSHLFLGFPNIPDSLPHDGLSACAFHQAQAKDIDEEAGIGYPQGLPRVASAQPPALFLRRSRR